MRSSKKHQARNELHFISAPAVVQGSTSMSRARSRNLAPVDDKVLFERLWKGTFRAIVAASLQARDKESNAISSRKSTLRSVISVKESHQLAEANQEKNLKMREALGISQYFVEGSSLDPERKAKEAAAAAAEEAKKKYALIPDSSSSSSPERVHEKEKKRKKKRSRTSHEKPESTQKKKKSVKKHKKERSLSPEVRKKKKRTSKDKSKRKSKHENVRKKQAHSSSSSSDSSSSSNDDESSSRSSSRNSNSEIDSDVSNHGKHKNASKHGKNHKSHRKRSSSSESIRYSKDTRSRKDIYEAKKGKRRRKSSRTSSSSSSDDDSSPKQYYRLEPILLKSKIKHKKGRQFIEVPKNSAFEIKKYDIKKRVRNSSSSSDEKPSKHESKRCRHSQSPVNAKSSKHHSSRMDMDKGTHRQNDLMKDSRKHGKLRRRSASKENSRQNRSTSSSSHHKLHRGTKLRIEDLNNASRKGKGKSSRDDDRHHDKESREKNKCSRKESPSPKHRNGVDKRSIKSVSPESDVSHKSKKLSISSKHKKLMPKSPSCSPPYKHKKHVIESPSHSCSPYRKKHAVKSSHVSPSKHHSKPSVSRESSSDSSARNRGQKHDYGRESSSSPSRDKYKDSKDKMSSVQKWASDKKSYIKKRSQSKSPLKISKTLKQKMGDENKNQGENLRLDKATDKLNQKQDSDVLQLKSWKSKAEVKDVSIVCESPSSSPSHQPIDNFRSSASNSKNKSPVQKKKTASPYDNGEYASANSHQITTSNMSSSHNQKSQNINSKSPNRDFKANDSKKKQKNESPAYMKQSSNSSTNKRSPVWSGIGDLDTHLSSLSPADNTVIKANIKKGSLGERNESPGPAEMKHFSVENSADGKKEKCHGIKNGSSSTQNLNYPESPSNNDSVQSDKIITPNTDYAFDSEMQKINNGQEHSFGRRRARILDSSPSRSRSASENPEVAHDVKNKANYRRTSELSHWRKRSCSLSGSERSSQSRSRSSSNRDSKSRSKSYSKSRSKSRSKSHSKSCTKSRSKTRSKSRSRTHSRSPSKSCSKSYSRSRSRSVSIYSRSRSRSYSSRSRSRSIARSPSIPRRRGSPSFLDKRRITRARSVSLPRSRRRTSRSLSKLSSRSHSRSSFSSSSSSLWSRVYHLH
ncbi:serine/arginine repetitive matrix protein 2-like isoform X2 [Stegodyphus dumicola]|uniref:serine/arginine repetitive matrix protein 2-like isoform X2 n=1 Tax=Stegodyphus dumicola TaxID=202533 RepID=UPI0015B070DA|nr:serine/arginine repetitive matrix protein 2-like isoform X2 [Stegodyphus dumicola]